MAGILVKFMISENWSKLSFKQKLDKFLDWFPQITQDESDFILDIISWDDETKAAFSFAKRIFEDE